VGLARRETERVTWFRGGMNAFGRAETGTRRAAVQFGAAFDRTV
jgi:hypothetical protein